MYTSDPARKTLSIMGLATSLIFSLAKRVTVFPSLETDTGVLDTGLWRSETEHYSSLWVAQQRRSYAFCGQGRYLNRGQFT
jgi:hypothetical protein